MENPYLNLNQVCQPTLTLIAHPISGNLSHIVRKSIGGLQSLDP